MGKPQFKKVSEQLVQMRGMELAFDRSPLAKLLVPDRMPDVPSKTVASQPRGRKRT